MQPVSRVYWRASFIGPPVAVRMVRGSANPLARSVFATLGNSPTGGHHALRSVAVGFVDVQPGFLQFLPTQTWVKCTSLDSSRCIVYSGIRFKVIRDASKKQSRLNGEKSGLGQVNLYIFILFFHINFFQYFMDDKPVVATSQQQVSICYQLWSK